MNTSSLKPRMKNKPSGNKTKVYECAHFEYEYDDLGRYCWCHNKNMPSSQCEIPCRSIYGQQFCRGYKKGSLRGEWVISDWEKKEAEEFKKNTLIKNGMVAQG